MSSKGGYTVAHPQRQGGDRFYNPPGARCHQQMYFQPHHHLMLQRQLLQEEQHQPQPQPQQQHIQSHQQQREQHKQMLLQRRAALMKEFPAETGKRKDGEASSSSVALSVPPDVGGGWNMNVTNLDRLMESVTPCIQARFFSAMAARGRRAREVDSLPFFHLEDLWEFFNEWSYYGAGVPLLLNVKVPIEQYYVPYLSGIQLYVKASAKNNGGPYEDLCTESYRLSRITAGEKASLASFQYLEQQLPYHRRPLADTISILVSQNPKVRKVKSCDLLPMSWICVAWYPIYRIPIGPTLRDLDASFLTFHSLSTQPNGNSPPRFHAPNTRTVRGIADPTAKVSLPVFALASFKLKGSIVSPCGPHECEQESSLVRAVDEWLRSLNVLLPDNQFFRNHFFAWR